MKCQKCGLADMGRTFLDTERTKCPNCLRKAMNAARARQNRLAREDAMASIGLSKIKVLTHGVTETLWE